MAAFMSATNKRYVMILGAAIVLLILLRMVTNGRSTEGFQEGATNFTLYYADWCPHCKTIKPAFQDWSKKGSMEINGKTVFLNMVEADTNPEKLKGKPVKGYPTFLLEKDGKFVEFSGERSRAGWEAWLKENV